MDSVPTQQLCAITIGGVNIWLYVLAVILLGCSAYFSASEIAFTTVNQIRLKNLADNKVRGARKAIYIIEHYEKAFELNQSPDICLKLASIMSSQRYYDKATMYYEKALKLGAQEVPSLEHKG